MSEFSRDMGLLMVGQTNDGDGGENDRLSHCSQKQALTIVKITGLEVPNRKRGKAEIAPA
jgi:hypothetical protein